MNIYDILILAAVLLVAVFALWRIILNRKKGKICGGNCSCCTVNCDTVKKTAAKDKIESSK